eukprot:Hpha_TRINITY_DN9378_c0_g2::TRINITY_DN9378_c0_g2_i1::g.26039::m.26039
MPQDRALRGHTLASALYGMRFQVDTPPVRAVFSALADLAVPGAPMDDRELALAFTGLQSQADTPDVRKVLEVLVTIVRSESNGLDDVSVGACLYGLHRQQPGAFVTELLEGLAKRIELSEEGMSAQAVGNALYGLCRHRDEGAVRAVCSGGRWERRMHAPPSPPGVLRARAAHSGG